MSMIVCIRPNEATDWRIYFRVELSGAGNQGTWKKIDSSFEIGAAKGVWKYFQGQFYFLRTDATPGPGNTLFICQQVHWDFQRIFPKTAVRGPGTLDRKELKIAWVAGPKQLPPPTPLPEDRSINLATIAHEQFDDGVYHFDQLTGDCKVLGNVQMAMRNTYQPGMSLAENLQKTDEYLEKYGGNNSAHYEMGAARAFVQERKRSAERSTAGAVVTQVLINPVLVYGSLVQPLNDAAQSDEVNRYSLDQKWRMYGQMTAVTDSLGVPLPSDPGGIELRKKIEESRPQR